MSGELVSETCASRVLVLDSDATHDVFEVLGIADGIARVRSPYMFEIGEELSVRIEHAGKVFETIARVIAHAGPEDARVTELELSEPSEPRPPMP